MILSDTRQSAPQMQAMTSNYTTCAWGSEAPISYYTRGQLVEKTRSGFVKGKKRHIDGFLPIKPFRITTRTDSYDIGSGPVMWGASANPCYTIKRSGAVTVGSYFSSRDAEATFKLPDPDFDQVTYVVNRAIADARSGALDVLTNIAEMPESMRMFRNVFRRIGNISHNLATYARTEKELRSLWLEYRYGWTPLISEAQKAIGLYNHTYRTGQLIRSKSSSDDTENSTDIYASGTEPYFHFSGEIRREYKFKYRGFAYATIVDLNKKLIQIDPFVTAYELLPYSFVLDWFIDLGSYIQATTPVSGVKLLGAGASVKTTGSTSLTGWMESAALAGNKSSGSSYQMHSVTYADYWRFPYTATLPSLNTRMTLNRAIDAYALLRNNVERIKRIK